MAYDSQTSSVNNVTKMKITAWTDPQSRKEQGHIYVQVNPESYNQKIEVKYDDKQAQGTTGVLPKFSKIEPSKMEFEFLFDRTGVINGATAGDMGVDEDIDNLQKLILDYSSDAHRPRFVTLYWGTLKFDGVLVTMDITYKLFNSDGAPLRAIVKASFIGSIEDKKRVAQENAQSPDLTKVRVIMEGDTLPLLCYEIYGDPKYYIEVARVNNLNNFRNLQTGTKIKFPPLAN